MRPQVMKKERAVGVVPSEATIYEVLEELAITVQNQLSSRVPFCAFNGEPPSGAVAQGRRGGAARARAAPGGGGGASSAQSGWLPPWVEACK
jgi:hypothetical protein